MEDMKCSTKDTFYIDPDVHDHDSLAARAMQLGLKMKEFLEEGVTVWVTTGLAREKKAEGGAAEALRGRRTSRIHRMQQMVHALAAPEVVQEERENRGVNTRARELGSSIMSDQAFRIWLERQEVKIEKKGKEPARRVMPHARRVGIEGIKSYRQHRLVMKDLDGLEPLRVKAFPPEVLRKSIVQKDAPPGISPFTTRDKWDREVIKMNKKIAQHGVGQVVFREKPRRGGWCECCNKQFVGKKSEHCASDAHHAAVAADPCFNTLLELTRGDQTFGGGKNAVDVDKKDPPLKSMNSGKGGGDEIDSIMAPKEMNPRTKSEESSQRMTALMPELILQRSPPRGCQGAVSKGISLWNEKGGGEEGLYKRGQSPEDKLVEAPVRCESGVMSPTRRRTTEKDSYDTMGERVGSVPGSENHGCDPDIDEAGMKSSIPRSGQRCRPSDVRCEPDDLSPVGHRSTKKDSCATKEARCGSVTLTEKNLDNSNLDGERETNVSTPQSGPVVIRPAEVKTSVDVLIESCKTQPDDSRAAEASPSGIHSTINTPGVNPNTPHSARRGRKPSREMRMLADTPEFVSAQKRRGSSTRRALRCKRRENAEPNDLGNRLLNATGYGEDTAAANSETAQGDAFENSDSHEMKARAASFVDHRPKRKGRTASQSSSRKNSNGSKKARRDQSNDFPERGNVSFPASSIIGTSLSSEEKCRNVDSSVGKTSVSLGLDTGAVASGNTNAASNEIRVPDEGTFPPSKRVRARIVADPSKPNSGVWRPARVP